MTTLPDLAKDLIDSQTFGTLATTNPNGSPQTSVIWVKREGDDVIFSTIRGRRKTLNMERDPRVALMLFDPNDPYVYAEIRGTVSFTTDGGPELIEELSQMYDGKSFHEKHADAVRLVCRLKPTKVISR
ncbi:MAG TPA: PPOX class F420-dependent oxidoreductase [Micromonosporaceae bacterium]|nr:PPOX class F420-dependent oxidoreductase [Micromonosporaceae bacterium]